MIPGRVVAAAATLCGVVGQAPWYRSLLLLVLSAAVALGAGEMALGAGLAACFYLRDPGEGVLAGGGVSLVGAVALPVSVGAGLWSLRGRGRSPAVAVAGLLATMGVVLAAKQWVAATVLPAALAQARPAFWLGAATAAGVLGAAALGDGARSRRLGALVLAAPAAAGLVRFAAVYVGDPKARMDAAESTDAVRLVYAPLVATADPEILRRLVVALPLRDEAALALGWREALGLGWRPFRADGVEVEVANALELAGRGGEAMRMLRRHPRQGAVDAQLALFERMAGEKVGWKGGTVGVVMPGTLMLDREMYAAGSFAVDLTAAVRLATLSVELSTSACAGPPRPWVVIDRGEQRALPTEGLAELGPLDPGPHRIFLGFDGDLVTEGCDRNVRFGALVGAE